MILETIVATACLSGNPNACGSSIDKYIKYYNLNDQIDTIKRQLEHNYPIIYFIGTTGNMIANKRVIFPLNKNLSLEGDYTNPNPIHSFIYREVF